MKKIKKNIKKDILTTTGIATILVFLIIFSFGGIKLAGSFNSIASTIKNFHKQPAKENFVKIEKDFDNKTENLQKAAVEIASIGEKIQNKKVLQTSTMLLAFDSENHLHRIMPKTYIDSKLKSLIKHMKYFNGKKIDTVFMLIPSSVVENKTKLPLGVTDYQNNYADKALNELKANNINTLDFREEFKKNRISLKNAFYNTDHHWKVQSGYRASKIAVNYINKKFKYKLDPKKIYRDGKNYSIKTKKKVYYGSFEQIAGKAFVGKKDDFTTILPKYPTKFRFRSYLKNGKLEVLYGKEMDIKGPFKDSLYDGRNSYSTYLNMAKVEIIINNLMPSSNKKCLVLGTSSARMATAFLAPYFKELRYADTQSNRFEKNMYKYVQNYKPDIIICMYSATSFMNYRTFRYFTK